jgi:PAS domain S-box-containing protein
VPTGGVQHQLRLPPAPESARNARRLVSDVLQAARADRFVDTAALLTSELVTNGIVHAATELEVVVEATSSWVRVEVGDGDPHLPSRRGYDEQASTGRGLEMVELLADDFGVEPLAERGKRVWFRLGVAPGTPTGESEPGVEPALKTRTIRLAQVPVTLYCAWQQHAEALLREATLAAYDPEIGEAVADYPLATRALGALADAACDVFGLRDQELAVADVSLDIAIDAIPWFPIMRDLLNRAGAMSRAGQLLVPPSLPELVAVREWVCDEIARQSAGLAPTPWGGVESVDAAPQAVSEDIVREVRASAQALVAADLSNRIVAVSRAAAELLGWHAVDLEGRRLVTIIPPRMRDRHIAGFTRHLLEGTSRILGQATAVPALRRDGSEIDILLLIERRNCPPYPPLFVATLTPAEE